MSILLKGVSCPRKPDRVQVVFYYDDPVREFSHTFNLKPEEVEIVETPHGRLIDVDAFDSRVREAGGMVEEELTADFKDGVQATLWILKQVPTVIEAEE